MSKSAKWVLGLLAGAALLSSAALLLPKSTSHPVARITLDGEVVEEIDLEQVDVPYSFTVTGASGLSNTILVEQGRIRVEVLLRYQGSDLSILLTV